MGPDEPHTVQLKHLSFTLENYLTVQSIISYHNYDTVEMPALRAHCDLAPLLWVSTCAGYVIITANCLRTGLRKT